MAKSKYAKSSAFAIKRAEKVAQAMRLRAEGLTTRAVAEKLGMSYGWVCDEVGKWCKAHPSESAEQYRRYVIEREERLIETHWPNRHDPDSAKVIQASDKILIAVLGLEAPKDVNLSGSVQVTNDAHDAILERLARQASSSAESEADPEPEPGRGKRTPS